VSVILKIVHESLGYEDSLEGELLGELITVLFVLETGEDVISILPLLLLSLLQLCSSAGSVVV
jgi:hypothetical protein